MPRTLKAKREAAPKAGGVKRRREASVARVPTPELPVEEQPAHMMLALLGGPTPREGLTVTRIGFDSMDCAFGGAGVFGAVAQDDYTPIGYTPAWGDMAGGNTFGAAVYA